MPEVVIVLDTETTGLLANKDGQPHHEIIQIAAAALRWGTLEVLDSFDTRVAPSRPLLADPKALQINGTTLEMLKDKPNHHAASTAWKLWLQQFGTRKWHEPILCAYNLPFDKQFVENFLPWKWNYKELDVMQLATAHLWMRDKVANVKLATVAQYFGVTNRAAHDARGDVEVTVKLLRRFILGPQAIKEPEKEKVSV